MNKIKQVFYALAAVAIVMSVCVGVLVGIFWIVYGVMAALGMVGSWPW